MDRERLGAALAAVLVLLAGCTAVPPVDEEPVSEPGAAEQQWFCEPVGAFESAGLSEAWTSGGGAMRSVHVSGAPEDGRPGRPTRDEATSDALASAGAAALDLLEQRGVSYEENKRRDIVTRMVDDQMRGGEIGFPRVRVVDRKWEECVARHGDAPSDTSWTAAVLVEYPIGLLRGDVNNVLWERRRAANEAEVLAASAEEHLEAGRWHAGLLDAARAADVVRATGAPLTDPGDVPVPWSDLDKPSVEARLSEALHRARAAARAAAPLTATPTEGVVVLESGAAAGEVVEFECSYRWNGETVPAVSVPVRFDVPGASAVLDATPLTDEAGVATCTLLAVYGPPGEYEMTVSLDVSAARAALAATTDQSAGSAWLATAHPSPRLAERPIHVVSATHAISVCATFGEHGDGDAAQVAAGFARRMERDGFRMADCGADVGVVVTGRVSLGVRGGALEATLEASAFDQRTAFDLGRTTVRASEDVPTDGSATGLREAEVLVLKEAGRLLAVYLVPRILASHP
jgi:hypothetical protein